MLARVDAVEVRADSLGVRGHERPRVRDKWPVAERESEHRILRRDRHSAVPARRRGCGKRLSRRFLSPMPKHQTRCAGQQECVRRRWGGTHLLLARRMPYLYSQERAWRSTLRARGTGESFTCMGERSRERESGAAGAGPRSAAARLRASARSDSCARVEILHPRASVSASPSLDKCWAKVERKNSKPVEGSLRWNK